MIGSVSSKFITRGRVSRKMRQAAKKSKVSRASDTAPSSIYNVKMDSGYSSALENKTSKEKRIRNTRASSSSTESRLNVSATGSFLFRLTTAATVKKVNRLGIRSEDQFLGAVDKPLLPVFYLYASSSRAAFPLCWADRLRALGRVSSLVKYRVCCSVGY